MRLVYFPNIHPPNSIDIRLLCVSDSLAHVTNTKQSPHISEDLTGMDAFTNLTFDKSLTKELLQSQLAMKFTSLVSISVVILFLFIMRSSRFDIWSQLAWTRLFSFPQIVRLVFLPSCIPCESHIALITQTRFH